MSRAWKRGVALAMTSLLALTACTAGDEPNGGGTTPESEAEVFVPGVYESPDAGDPQKTDVLTVADYAEIRDLDPAAAISAGFSGGSALVAIYDQLVRWDEAQQDYVPHLAESVEPNDDFTEWTVTLRDGTEFSDGTPVNADAVVASVERYVTNNGFDMGVIGPVWEGVEKVDDRTVVFRLTTSWGSFEALLGQGMGMIAAPAAYEGAEFSPIGAGAFTFGDYRPTEHLELAANPNYWDGAPHVQLLRFVWLGDDNAKADSFASDAVDAILIRSPEQIYNLRSQGQPGAVMLQNEFSMLINNREGHPGHDERVRKAMALAIDPQAITDRIYSGHGLPSKNLFSPASKWHSDVEPNPTDPEAASELLEEAKADGFDGTVVISAINRDEALAIQAQLEAAGFQVELDIARTPADITEAVFVRREFDVALAAVPAAEEDPYQRISANLHSEARTNVMGYQDPDMDALIEELRGAQGDDQAEVLSRIEAEYQEHVPGISLRGATPYFAWDDDIHGVVATNNVMMAFENVWRS